MLWSCPADGVEDVNDNDGSLDSVDEDDDDDDDDDVGGCLVKYNTLIIGHKSDKCNLSSLRQRNTDRPIQTTSRAALKCLAKQKRRECHPSTSGSACNETTNIYISSGSFFPQP